MLVDGGVLVQPFQCSTPCPAGHTIIYYTLGGIFEDHWCAVKKKGYLCTFCWQCFPFLRPRLLSFPFRSWFFTGIGRVMCFGLNVCIWDCGAAGRSDICHSQQRSGGFCVALREKKKKKKGAETRHLSEQDGFQASCLPISLCEFPEGGVLGGGFD